tara:strand:- start:523 stop:1215 length:693 start_codon:yes stop_codon:yes gene_type:complete
MPTEKADLIFNRLEELGIIVGNHLFSSDGFKLAQSEGTVRCDNCSQEFPSEETIMEHQVGSCGSGTWTWLTPLKESEVEEADFDTILDPDYIYIFWNGLNVGKYGQSSVYVYLPIKELNIEDIIEMSDNLTWSGNYPTYYGITFDMRSRCPDSVLGICWRSQNGGYYESWSKYEVLHGGNNVWQFLDFNKTVVNGNDSDSGKYRAYKIPIFSTSSLQIRALNYARKGINL